MSCIKYNVRKAEKDHDKSRRGTRRKTYSVTVVADFNNEVILTKIPHRGSATGVGRGQDVLDLSVPCHTAYVLHRL